MRQHSPVPADPVDTRPEIGRPRDNQFDIGICPPHQFRGLKSKLAIILGRTMAHLPGSVHLVAQAPILHLPWLVATVLLAKPSGGRVAREVHVLHPLLRFVPTAGPEIRTNVRLCVDLFYIIQKLVSAETVVFNRPPCHLQATWPRVPGSNAVSPVVVG